MEKPIIYIIEKNYYFTGVRTCSVCKSEFVDKCVYVIEKHYTRYHLKRFFRCANCKLPLDISLATEKVPAIYIEHPKQIGKLVIERPLELSQKGGYGDVFSAADVNDGCHITDKTHWSKRNSGLSQIESSSVRDPKEIEFKSDDEFISALDLIKRGKLTK